MTTKSRFLTSAVAALALGLTACSSTQPQAEPSPAASTVASSTPSALEPEATPSTSPTASAKESPVTNIIDPSPGTVRSYPDGAVEALREMPIDEYLALSAAERQPLVNDMLEYALEWQEGTFGAHWDGDTSELYKYNPLEIASKANSAKEIAMQHLYWTQLALSQTEDLDTSGTFDPDNAAKALAGGFTNNQYRSSGGESGLDNNKNRMFTYWMSVMDGLDTTTSHDYAQNIVSAKFTEKQTVHDYTDDSEHLIVGVEFITEPLPETLDDNFKEGTYTYNRMGFVWNDDVSQWQQYTGVVQNQPVGWKPSK